MTSPVGASSAAAAGSSTSVPGPTPDEQTAIPELVHQQVMGMLQLYHQYLQSIMSQVLPGFQLPSMPKMPMPMLTLPVVPPQQEPRQPDEDNSDSDDHGSADLGAS